MKRFANVWLVVVATLCVIGSKNAGFPAQTAS
jgi:hypothetical protein